jgi:hypothetical protein
MAQIPLNAAGGKAAVVQAKMPDTDVTRLLRLAELRGISRSAIARELLHDALDQLELADTGPPHGG